MNPEIADALLAAAYEWWTKPESVLKSTSWTTQGAVTLLAGGPDVAKGILSVRMLGGFTQDVDQPPQPVANVERSPYKAAWHDAMKIVLDGHKTTGTYEAATLPQERKPVGAE